MSKMIITTSIVIFVILGLFFHFSSLRESTQPVTALNTQTAGPQILSSVEPTAQSIPLHTIGQVTRHVSGFVGTVVRVQGYMLAMEKTYAIFSDETGGAIGVYDLPVIGSGIEGLTFKQKYILQGMFVHGGLNASNHNAYHLELSNSPQPVQ